jgi:GNAT superfamily N-acetyltransferase
MRLMEVVTPAQAREFIQFPVRLYAADPSYVRPLDRDIEAVYDRARNKYFRHGELIRWLLVDEAGRTQGRVAAFVNEHTAHTFAQPTGGMGFFECIDSQEAADILLNGCRTWLAAQGMEAMDGPINFGDRDQWWGLLVDNFDAPLYGQNYNPPYYRRLLETYGFECYFNQYTYFRKISEPFSPTYLKRAASIFQHPDYHFEHLRLNNLSKYSDDFRHVYNKAWVKHDGVKEMTVEQSANIMKKLRPIIDERVCWFAYYQGEAVGFFISLPELNELFRYVDGNLNWLGKLKFAWHRWRGAVHTLTGIAFGIVPDHQRKGLEMAFILAVAGMMQDTTKVPYDDFVMNWIGDFNPKMMRVAESIGGRIWRTHATYRYLLDREKPFERAPAID